MRLKKIKDHAKLWHMTEKINPAQVAETVYKHSDIYQGLLERSPEGAAYFARRMTGILGAVETICESHWNSRTIPEVLEKIDQRKRIRTKDGGSIGIISSFREHLSREYGILPHASAKAVKSMVSSYMVMMASGIDSPEDLAKSRKASREFRGSGMHTASGPRYGRGSKD